MGTDQPQRITVQAWLRRRLWQAVIVALSVFLIGCGDKANVNDEISKATGTPLCSDILSGEATMPANNRCVDDAP